MTTWIAAGAFVLGPLLAHFDVVPALAGFVMFVLGALASLVGAIGAVLGAVRGQGLSPARLPAVVVALAFLAIVARSAGGPRINDFTTDPADPPAFQHAGSEPANAGRDLAYPKEFAPIQQGCCSDLRPARVATAPQAAFARARTVAEQTATWKITYADAASGMIEAIATTPLFHFKDDLVIRVRPDGDGRSRIDLRSKSRDGKGDIGANANRIRAFVTAVEAAG